MVYWNSLYEENATNALIAAGGTNWEILFSSATARGQITKNNQSFNALEIVNNSANCVIHVDLDGLATRRRTIFPKSSLVIEPENGIYFNTVRITNTSAAVDLAAAELTSTARIVAAVKEG